MELKNLLDFYHNYNTNSVFLQKDGEIIDALDVIRNAFVVKSYIITLYEIQKEEQSLNQHPSVKSDSE